jgi:hypothetical protein
MADDKLEGPGTPSIRSGRASAPPTIDLEATEISGETKDAGADAPPKIVPRPAGASISAAIIAALSGAAAAALVPASGLVRGLPGERFPQAVPAAPQVNSAALARSRRARVPASKPRSRRQSPGVRSGRSRARDARWRNRSPRYAPRSQASARSRKSSRRR